MGLWIVLDYVIHVWLTPHGNTFLRRISRDAFFFKNFFQLLYQECLNHHCYQLKNQNELTNSHSMHQLISNMMETNLLNMKENLLSDKEDQALLLDWMKLQTFSAGSNRTTKLQLGTSNPSSKTWVATIILTYIHIRWTSQS